jgi:uncharacterized protein (DUF433 family)
VRPQFDDDEKRVTFLDFVQTLAIRSIRIAHKVPLQKIREAVDRASQHYQIDFPFARRHTTYLDGKEILIDLPERGSLVELSGKTPHQTVMRPIVEVYMKDLGWGAGGLASNYKAFEWHQLAIMMNPRRRFGEPVVEACGHTARTLWEACTAEGSVEAAAEAYGVESDHVELAYRYFDLLQGRTAA